MFAVHLPPKRQVVWVGSKCGPGAQLEFPIWVTEASKLLFEHTRLAHQRAMNAIALLLAALPFASAACVDDPTFVDVRALGHKPSDS